MPFRCRELTLAVLMACALTVPCLAAPKTDVVELLNGDRLTCEIRKLERGKLTVKTDGIGTLAIEWNDVAYVTSAADYEIELSSGERHYGALARGDANTIHVVSALGTQRLAIDSVVRISPLGRSFFRRLDGSIDAGFSFTQANLQTQWTLNTTASYRSRRWLSSLDGDSTLTSRDDADSQTRNDLTLRSERFLWPRWSAIAFSQLQQNEELSLNLRAVFGGGMQRILTQSNQTTFSVVGGLAFTREEYAGADDLSVAEAVAGARWDWFTFDGRATNLDVSVISFYALTAGARARLEIDTTFKSDIVGDLYWSINLFESYNSGPPPGQKTNDFGVSASVGWSF